MELYKELARHRSNVPAFDRHGLWKACEETALETMKSVLLASQTPQSKKHTALEQASMYLNLLRVLLRLAWETKCIDHKKAAALQIIVDDTGRMLGGWLRSLKNTDTKPPPLRSRRRKCLAADAQTLSLRFSSEFQLLTLSRPSFS